MVKENMENVLMNIGGVNIYVSDKNYTHFNSLPKSKQEAIKQMVTLKLLQEKYDK